MVEEAQFIASFAELNGVSDAQARCAYIMFDALHQQATAEMETANRQLFPEHQPESKPNLH